MKHSLTTPWAMLLLCCALTFSCNTNKQSESTPELVKPTLQGENPEEEEGGPKEGKNRSWTLEEARQHAREMKRVSRSIAEARGNSKRRAGATGAYANNNLVGHWEQRGPFNMPGAFQFCEMDEGTDTVYAVTCGHYGGAQFIWKGTLWDDDWTMITPKIPSRYNDLIVLPNGNERRVIAAHEQGQIMYSDDAGATWTYSTGISGGILSTIVNRQDNNILYATDGDKVFVSTNLGTSFQEFQDMSNENNACLYSPRWTAQPGASNVYLAIGNTFYTLNGAGTQFTSTGTLPTDGRISIGGDTRKLWVTLNKRKWHASTNQGATWSYINTTNYWYSSAEPDMAVGMYPGVNPEDPDILIGGYSIPLITKDAGATTNSDANQYWGYYQNSINNDPKVRINFHPDFQGNQFFYDKNGDLITLRSSDGGVFVSYDEWVPNNFPTYDDIKDVYYNISLLGKPSQETYRGGFMYGAQNKDHLSCGTQDQGWQDTRSSTFGTEQLSWNQIGGGDGPCCITGDGVIGWQYNYFGEENFRRIQLYDGTTFRGQQGTKSAEQDFDFSGGSYFTPSVGDWNNGDRIWILSNTLRRIDYNGGSITALEESFSGGSSYVQGLAQSQVDPSLVYCLYDGNVHKSTNTGTNWTQVANSSATGMSGYSQSRGMGWSSPLDQDIVLFASQSGTNVRSVFSTNGGASWTDVTGSGANLFPDAEVNGMAGTKDGKKVFASTNMGPYVFVVDEAKWYPLATDLDVPIFWGQIVYCVDYGDEEVVHFSTWGQGVWDFVIEESVAPIAEFNVDKTTTCDGSVVFTDVSVNAETWDWDFGDGNNSSDQNPSHSYAASGIYTVSLTVTAGQESSTETKTDLVEVVIVDAPTTGSEQLCQGEEATVIATSAESISWYDSETNGNLIAIGSSFLHTAINDTSFYAEANAGGAIQSFAAPDTNIGTGGQYGFDGNGLLFDALEPVIIKSVDVYSYEVGDRTFEVLDGVGGSVIASKTINVGLGKQTIYLDFDLVPASGYFFKMNGLVELYRNNSGTSYPYTINNLITLTESNVAPANPGFYYFFYNWKVQASGCRSTRSAFMITVDPLPSSPIIAANGNTLSIPSTYSTYQWYLDYVLIPGATSSEHLADASGAYTVEVGSSQGLCMVMSDTLDFVITSNSKEVTDSELYLYPNPMSNNAVLKGSEANGNWTIINGLGKVVLEGLGEEIDVSELSPGAYFLSTNGKVIEFVKE